jgi:predicted dehydrogenase
MPLQTRRDFVRVATGLGAAAVLTRFTHAAAPSERVRLAFVGVKAQGTSNLRNFLKQPTAQVVALCDVDTKVLGTAAELVEKQTKARPETVADYRRLLDRKDIDAVVITTPDHWHALPTIHACLAEKDVYCEKPLSLTVAEGRAMVKAARKTNRIVQTGSQQRSEFKGYFRTAAELVRNGTIGQLKAVKVGLPRVNFADRAVKGAMDNNPPVPPELDYDAWIGPAPHRPYNVNRVHYLFRFFWDYSGGQLTNFGAHDLDITQWALGMDDSGPVSVEVADTKFVADGSFEVPESCLLTYRYANGVPVYCGQNVDGYRGGVTFEGDKGTIYVNRSTLRSTPAEILKEEVGPSGVRLYVSPGHHANFLECVKSRKLPICDVEIGHRSATVCHLGNIAIRTGRKITWDPAKETIAGDTEAAAMLSRPYRKPWELPAV